MCADLIFGCRKFALRIDDIALQSQSVCRDMCRLTCPSSITQRQLSFRILWMPSGYRDRRRRNHSFSLSNSSCHAITIAFFLLQIRPSFRATPGERRFRVLTGNDADDFVNALTIRMPLFLLANLTIAFFLRSSLSRMR